MLSVIWLWTNNNREKNMVNSDQQKILENEKCLPYLQNTTFYYLMLNSNVMYIVWWYVYLDLIKVFGR
jgi:hypothetical protein